MARIHVHAIRFVILILLTGCGGPIIFYMEMKAPGYSIGPISSKEFSGLVKNAIPKDKGKLRVFGKAYWGEFGDRNIFVSRHFSGIAALTDSNILLLLFNDDDQRYEILTQVPYRFISYDPRRGWGRRYGEGLSLYFEIGRISFGEKQHSSTGPTYFTFTKLTESRIDPKKQHWSTGLTNSILRVPTESQIDPEKNKLAHLLFEEKVARKVFKYISDDIF